MIWLVTPVPVRLNCVPPRPLAPYIAVMSSAGSVRLRMYFSVTSLLSIVLRAI